MGYETTPVVRARLRAERKRRRWDPARLAREMPAVMDDTQRPTVASLARSIERWEKGQVTRTTERYRLVYAEVFGIPENDLFGLAVAEAVKACPCGKTSISFPSSRRLRSAAHWFPT